MRRSLVLCFSLITMYVFFAFFCWMASYSRGAGGETHRAAESEGFTIWP